jgi:YVTN family beta-propeller protein
MTHRCSGMRKPRWSSRPNIAQPLDAGSRARAHGAGWFSCLMLALLAAPAWAAPFAYVTNAGSNSVSVIDTAANTVVGAPIALGGTKNPARIAVNPAGTRVYVTNVGDSATDDTVSVIDTATNTLIGPQIPVGRRIGGGIAVNPAGTHVYVAGGAGIVVIDTATNAVVGPAISGPNEPQDVAINPAGTRAYAVGVNGLSGVWVIDTASASVIGPTIQVSFLPFAIAVNSSGTRVYAGGVLGDIG